MRRLLNLEDNIALYHIWNLFSLSFEQNCVTVLHTSLHIHLESFSFLHETISPALLADFSESFTLATAFITWLLHLHLHHAHIDILSDLSTALTRWTDFHLAALSARALTFVAVDFTTDFKL